jgi:hypothetical protein
MIYLTSRILLLVTHFVDNSARMYHVYSLNKIFNVPSVM